ncbi:hypothetical protein BDM02DRAFT_492370 [Thelephora ganbajun]|uniref:Uncharacterized protein n=1 Tax=Thelephora ganbajun TaxID=370292 RepID=A0ACB6Z7B7_THEGA|nr:hypothetical protein BDM02DRAFT_492370 [Thelephora ganbajun]
MLIHRRCPSCKRNEDPAPPFIIEDVLQDASTAPYPCNHAPRSMKAGDILVNEFTDMTSVYCYNFRNEPLPVETAVDSGLEKGACVKHVFTGPYEDLKVQATGLFLQIQEGIELGWQSVTTGIAEGMYYSWASPRHGWVDNEIPQCIHQVRKLISKFVGDYGNKDSGDESHLDEMIYEELPADPQPSTSTHNAKKQDKEVAENIRINHIVALAWTASGSRRGTFVSAKDDPVFILCLGATVELELEWCLPDPTESIATADTESNPPVSQDVAVSGTVDEGVGQKKTKGRKQRKPKKNPDAEYSLEADANAKGKGKGKGKERVVVPQAAKEKPKPKPKPTAPPHERLKINMVHGDVLILSGGDYIYTLTRTGISILLFALPDAQY